jgi:hypothetical protein
VVDLVSVGVDDNAALANDFGAGIAAPAVRAETPRAPAFALGCAGAAVAPAADLFAAPEPFTEV